ncbi:organic hydroperoxide resistance protein [Isoptericola chiayiensis]|uniref:Organic hydroperoxide resistance protein n=1 Tax=Isoptericola chiayiensis TaxID=579446 RepID=A0ABP8YEA7_9MICO|nr:organic hydroperoxide resistance protein [Isoptericola chiayiensis]NOV99919.1 Ohr subfamily peroxiredoxin [Isoptericola chiayiensis]
MIENVAYTAEALSTGAGRDGRVRSDDGRVDLDMAIPQQMGGSGAGSNPEQLFAAGYAACFHSALQNVARVQKVSPGETSVGSRVSIGANGAGGFELAVELEVVVPDLPREQAEQLVEAAEKVCPYSNATRGNIDLRLSVVEG